MGEVGMDARTFAATLLKVAGLVIVVYTLSKLPSYFPIPTASEVPMPPSLRIISAAFDIVPPILLGLVLWFFPGKVANKIIASSENSAPMAIAGVERVAVTVLGLYLAAWGISDLAYQLGLLFRLEENRSAVIPGGLAALAEIVVGGVLSLGARRVVSLLRGPREG
jgi:hypothetical protein